MPLLSSNSIQSLSGLARPQPLPANSNWERRKRSPSRFLLFMRTSIQSPYNPSKSRQICISDFHSFPRLRSFFPSALATISCQPGTVNQIFDLNGRPFEGDTAVPLLSSSSIPNAPPSSFMCTSIQPLYRSVIVRQIRISDFHSFFYFRSLSFSTIGTLSS